MSRHVVAYEGKPAIDGFFLHHGALRMKRDKIPVTMAFDSENIIGLARDLERDDKTGEVSVEVEFVPEAAAMTAGLCASIAISDVVGDRENVREGAIIQIAFITDRFWV